MSEKEERTNTSFVLALVILLFSYGVVLVFFDGSCTLAARYDEKRFDAAYPDAGRLMTAFYGFSQAMLRITMYCENRYCGYIIPVCSEPLSYLIPIGRPYGCAHRGARGPKGIDGAAKHIFANSSVKL